MILSASEWFTDSGADIGEELGNLETGDLINLRWDLIDHFDISRDRDVVIRWLVEAIEHEIGGRWIRNHVNEVGAVK